MPKKGVEIKKEFPGHGACKGVIISSATVDSTLYIGKEREAWRVKYSDGFMEEFEEEEIRPLLVTTHL